MGSDVGRVVGVLRGGLAGRRGEEVSEGGGRVEASSGMVFGLSDAFQHAWKAQSSAVTSGHVLLALVARTYALRRQMKPILPKLRAAIGQASPTAAPTSLDSPGAVPGPTRAASFWGGVALRESAWLASTKRLIESGVEGPYWSDEVAWATASSVALAEDMGLTHAQEAHLLVCTLRDQDGQASTILRSLGIEPSSLRRNTQIELQLRLNEQSVPPQSVVDLRVWNVVSTGQGALTTTFQVLSRLTRGPRGGPMMLALQREAVRQAIRLGHRQVGQEHLIMAICSIAEDLAIEKDRLRDGIAPANAAAYVLAQRGVDYLRLFMAAAGRPAPDGLTSPDRSKYLRLADPLLGLDFVEVMNGSQDRAEKRGAAWVGTTDVLASLVASDSTGMALLRGLGVDTDELATATGAATRD